MTRPTTAGPPPAAAASDRWWTVAVGVISAAPSLVWAFAGSGLIHDDWGFASVVRFGGLRGGLEDLTDPSAARPLAGVYYALSYAAFGDGPVPHVLLLAVLNGLAGALFFLLARRMLPSGIARWSALAWAVVPNRGSSRLWLAMAPGVLAVVLLLVGLLLVWRGRLAVAGVALALGVLSYEPVVAPGLAGLALWALADRRRIGRAAVAAVPALAATAFILATSPKLSSDAGVASFSTTDRLIPAHFGTGVFGPGRPTTVGSVALLLFLTVAVARTVVPGFTPSPYERHGLAGLAVLAIGAAPFALDGFPFTTDGIFDRGNLVADLGTSILFGSVLAAVAAVPLVRLGAAAAALLVLGVALGTGRDLRSYRAAVRDGEALQRQLAEDVPRIDGPLVVGPPLPNRAGVAQFVAYHDLGAALQVRRDDPSINARIALSDRDFARAPEPYRYDRRTGVLEAPTSGS